MRGWRCLVAAVVLSMAGQAGASEQASLKGLLDAQKYRQAAPLVTPLLAEPHPDVVERGLIYDWLFAADDLAEVDRRVGRRDSAGMDAVDLLAAGRLALAGKDFDRARRLYSESLAKATTAEHRAYALRGQGLVAFESRDYDAALAKFDEAGRQAVVPDVLVSRSDALIRLGRTNEAIDSLDQAVRLNPYHEAANYGLGNGYTRVNYTALALQCGAGFDRAASATRQASDAFDQGRIDAARQAADAALAACAGYGRAHAVLAKVAEAERMAVDVHRAFYEARFAATPMPVIPQIDRYVLNWNALTERQRKRVALSVAPWKSYVPVLVAGGASLYIKPLYMRLSETPGAASMRDTRIDYDSRLWDDVRGVGGHLCVTGAEDVERTILGRYNTVLHEMTHQVNAVMTADQVREIQELYRRAKERDAKTGRGFLSRYAGGSVLEYFAEGANSQGSPRRDAYDFEEIRRERLAAIDPDLQALIVRDFALTDEDVKASLPIALVDNGMNRLESGELPAALALFQQALGAAPDDEQVLAANLYGLSLGGTKPMIDASAERAVELHPDSGPIRLAAIDALWHGGASLRPLVEQLRSGREALRKDDRFSVDLALGDYEAYLGDSERALQDFDRALTYQADSPEALWGRARALALARHWDAAFAAYGQAVNLRTGLAPLRLDMARDLILAGRVDAARKQMEEVRTLNRNDPDLLALDAWVSLVEKRPTAALEQSQAALAAGSWCDMALIMRSAALQVLGRRAEADALQPLLRARLSADATPRHVYRKDTAGWISVEGGAASLQRVRSAVAAMVAVEADR